MSRPTVTSPWVVQADGTVDVLVFQGRTWRAAITHTGLTDPTGYSARIGFKASFDDGDTDMLLSGGTESGEVTLTQIPDSGGTLIEVVLSDESTETVTTTRGKWDLVLESAGGVEDTVVLGDWYLQRRVTP